MSIFRLFKKKGKESAVSSVQTERDQRTYLINGKWVHVPNCVDDTPWAEADEREYSRRKKK